VAGVARLQVLEPVRRLGALIGLGDEVVDAADVRDRSTPPLRTGEIFTRFG